MSIPDPIERMESNIEALITQWEEAQADVPAGMHRCPYCRNLFDYEPISASAAPDAPAMCYDCLPDDARKMYDNYDAWLASQSPKSDVESTPLFDANGEWIIPF